MKIKHACKLREFFKLQKYIRKMCWFKTIKFEIVSFFNKKKKKKKPFL